MAPLRAWNIGGGNLYGTNTGREHLSHTALASLLACPQRYAYQYEQRLELVARSAPLTLGKAYQLAIEHSDPDVGVRSLQEEGRAVLSQADQDRSEIEQQIVRSASELYLRRFQPVECSKESRKEFAYRVRIRNPENGYLSRTFDLLGYADEWLDMGNYAALVENKLVGQITAMKVRNLPLDRQIALASYGTWRATGMPVREVFYRWVRKPSIKPRQGEAIPEFCERLAADYVEREDFYCHEERLIRSIDDLTTVEAELWEWANMLRQGRKRIFTRNTAHCEDFGGCPFIPLCLGEEAEGLYRHRVKQSPREELPVA